ncbi:MAG: UvrD-helicase domain-containing protein [bacterium]
MSRCQAPSPKYTLIKAAAGSGKTYRIAKEYIKYILSDPKQIKSILAITFTNKAASEMKERILNFLKGLSGNAQMLSEDAGRDIAPLRESLMEELNMREEDLKAKATEALDCILYSKKGGGYSDFSVMTIDSFTNSMTKAFSYELDIPPEYGVGLNIKNIISEAISDIISRAGKSTDEERRIGEILLEYLLYRTESGKSITMEKEIQKVSESIRNLEKNFPDKRVDIPEEYKRNLKESLKKHAGEREKNKEAILKLCREIIEIDFEITNSTEIDFNNYKYKKGGFLSPVLQFINDDSDENMLKFETSKRFHAGIENIDDIRSKESSAMNTSMAGDKLDEMRKKGKEIREYLKYNLKSHLRSGIIMNYICSNLIYDSVREYLDDYQIDNEILFIDELNGRIKSLFTSGEEIPFIYFRIGENFRKYMIDEFQDTSEIQWNNLKPLIDNAVASSDGSFTGVGDLKQAIYRFRGGSTEVMQKTEKDAAEESLDSNYRSDKNIISFNNHVFDGLLNESVPATQSLKEIYQKNVTQKHKDYPVIGFTNDIDGGYIEIHQTENKVNLKEHSEKTDFVFNRVKNLLERGYSQSDIGILTRTTKESNEIARQITGREAAGTEINVISADSLFISFNPFVDFIVTLIRNCSEKEDSASLARAVYIWKEIAREKKSFDEAERILSDTAKVNKYGLGRIVNKQIRESILRAMFTNEAYEKFSEMIDKRLNKYGIYETIALIIEIIINPLCRDYSDSMAHISRLKEAAYKLMKEANAKDFIEYFDEYGEGLCIASPANENAVTISTIHKSKGLQYKAVIIPFVDWNDAKEMHKSYLIYDDPKIAVPYGVIKDDVTDAQSSEMTGKAAEEKAKSIFDTANILYVALTRAKHELFIMTKALSENKDEKNSLSSADKLLGERIKTLENYPEIKRSSEDGATVIKIGQERTREKEKRERVEEVENKFDMHNHEDNLFIDRTMHCVLPEEMGKELKRVGGLIFHEVLSKVKRAEDIENAVEGAIKSGIINSGERKDYIARVSEIIEHDEFKEFFGEFDRIYTERELIFNKKVIRSDRVMIKGNRAIVLDYKTGEENKKDKEQIANYVKAYRELGYEAEGWLAYTNEKRRVRADE